MLFLWTSLLSEQLLQSTKEKNVEVSHPKLIVSLVWLIAIMSARKKQSPVNIETQSRCCIKSVYLYSVK